MTDILILAALPQEADALFEGQGVLSRQWPIPVRHVSLNDARITVGTCGVGKVNAALAVGLLVAKHTRWVGMTGTCGQIAPLEGNCFWIKSAAQHDYGAKAQGGFTPYPAGAWPMGVAAGTQLEAMPDPGLGLPHAAMITGDIFLECQQTAAALAAHHHAQLIDMEVAAVAQASVALGLPWAAIKAVTDNANETSSGAFTANVASAAARSAKATERLILATLHPA
jgi:adenosylhomocysteine nucleosidase